MPPLAQFARCMNYLAKLRAFIVSKCVGRGLSAETSRKERGRDIFHCDEAKRRRQKYTLRVSHPRKRDENICSRHKRERRRRGAEYERGSTRPIHFTPAIVFSQPVSFQQRKFRSTISYPRTILEIGIANECEKIDRRRFELL